jgi:tRNA(adenine34) deaminase
MTSLPKPDEHWMRHAMQLAARAETLGEVPVGAVLVRQDVLLAEGWNRPIGECDPTAHAEIMCLRAGGQADRNYRLAGTTLYVTLEPCLMCVGAMVHARVTRVVYGAADPKSGAVDSVCRGFELPGLNHRVDALGGILAAECGDILKLFFRRRREQAGD